MATLFQFQESGMYHCRVKGKLVEVSAENYHFIKLGYPRRMIQQEKAAGIVGKQDIIPVSSVMDRELTVIPNSRNNPVPAPIDKTLASFASDLSPRPEKRNTVSDESENDIKEISQASQEFQAEAARRRSSSRRSDCQPHVLVSDNPFMSVDDPTKPDFPTHIDGSVAGSLDVAKRSQSEASGSGNTAITSGYPSYSGPPQGCFHSLEPLQKSKSIAWIRERRGTRTLLVLMSIMEIAYVMCETATVL
ncbi:hypothetical protein N7463_002341 [Penicillium fimorum]|uniref:Uncharacterized protein n=1 Tax=Penicillium fimorum TaxID=1882269 RepID=A0A9W9Y0I5_9EURO|nr:hypothetical protein N7463_002341 [Penicillium fimorum]